MSMSNCKLPFPWKLYQMLEDAEEKGYDHIISWAKDGQSFEIHDTAVFSDTVMKDYFKQKHIKSFTRQLYIYGFSKVNTSATTDITCFAHPSFIRGNKTSSLSLERNQSQDRRRSAQRRGSMGSTTSWSSMSNAGDSVQRRSSVGSGPGMPTPRRGSMNNSPSSTTIPVGQRPPQPRRASMNSMSSNPNVSGGHPPIPLSLSIHSNDSKPPAIPLSLSMHSNDGRPPTPQRGPQSLMPPSSPGAAGLPIYNFDGAAGMPQQRRSSMTSNASSTVPAYAGSNPNFQGGQQPRRPSIVSTNSTGSYASNLNNVPGGGASAGGGSYTGHDAYGGTANQLSQVPTTIGVPANQAAFDDLGASERTNSILGTSDHQNSSFNPATGMDGQTLPQRAVSNPSPLGTPSGTPRTSFIKSMTRTANNNMMKMQPNQTQFGGNTMMMQPQNAMSMPNNSAAMQLQQHQLQQQMLMNNMQQQQLLQQQQQMAMQQQPMSNMMIMQQQQQLQMQQQQLQQQMMMQQQQLQPGMGPMNNMNSTQLASDLDGFANMFPVDSQIQQQKIQAFNDATQSPEPLVEPLPLDPQLMEQMSKNLKIEDLQNLL